VIVKWTDYTYLLTLTEPSATKENRKTLSLMQILLAAKIMATATPLLELTKFDSLKNQNSLYDWYDPLADWYKMRKCEQICYLSAGRGFSREYILSYSIADSKRRHHEWGMFDRL